MRKLCTVAINAHKKAFEVEIEGGQRLEFPYTQCDPSPSKKNPVTRVEIDGELGRTGFAYQLRSGSEGVVLSDHVLRYHRDPAYLVEEMLYELSCQARERLEHGPIGIRAVSRRLRTSPTQIYRLMDPTYYGKSLDQMVRLLSALDAEVGLVIR